MAKLAKNEKTKRVLERIKHKNDTIKLMKEKFRVQRTLKKYNIDKLDLASEKEYKDFVDNGLKKDYKNMPNILKIAHFNTKLQKALGLLNDEVFLSKKHFSHFRIDRKQDFKQDLPKDFFYQIPKLIQDSKEAYIDTKKGNFFIVTALDNDNLAFLHFNVDELGNFIVTAKKALKEDLNKQEYIKIDS